MEKPRVLFFNQGNLGMFGALLSAASGEVGPVAYCNFDGVFDDLVGLKHLPAPSFKSGNIFVRLLSWLKYCAVTIWYIVITPGKPLLFLVTNPPFLPFIGWLAKKIFRYPYILLFYDIYPDALVQFSHLRDTSWIVRAWRFLNRFAIKDADEVVTLSPQLVITLSQYCDHEVNGCSISIIPTWVDIDRIIPIPKHENWFVSQYNLGDKFVVLYSGNIGSTHDLSILVDVADLLQVYADIEILVISDSPKRRELEMACQSRGIQNISFLSRVDEATLPYSLSCADVAIVTLAEGAEAISMPSKTYYMMAAGNALLGISPSTSDVAAVIQDFECGANIPPGDTDGAIKVIEHWYNCPDQLEGCQKRARYTAEKHFSSEVCVPKILDLIRKHI